MLFDTHTHLDSNHFDHDREQVIHHAREQGVMNMINIGYNQETILTTLALAERYDFIYAAVGWHPNDSINMDSNMMNWLAKTVEHEKVVAMGEIGLDYYWNTSPKDLQQRVFRNQIGLARECNLPLIIHNREAHEDIVRILREEKAHQVGGVIHSFSGDWEMAKLCLHNGFYISFGGPITFKNAHQTKEVFVQIPDERLLIETDAPYLTPHPFRGKRNETAYVRIIAEIGAKLKRMEFVQFCNMTTKNAKACFNINEKGVVNR